MHVVSAPVSIERHDVVSFISPLKKDDAHARGEAGNLCLGDKTVG